METSLTKTFPLRTITAVGLLVAIGTVAAPFSIPVGVARVFPAQHALNVLAGVLLGPGPAVVAAILTSTIRNLLGTGTPLAFPGSIFGALLAGLAFRYFKKEYLAAAGELLGTGLIGALVAFPVAKWLLGFGGLAYFFIIPFTLSSLSGSMVGVIILRLWNRGTGAKNKV
ncbi:MAG: energy coupling factor transporter S component ThiW [Dethiobacter sp.]|jgi:energy coupling factor transporter S component ThiW|nr:MAG: energy coupling factor transporter S component ThiW [Dethiobacter sp.]